VKNFIAAAVVAVLEIHAVPAFADPPPWAPAHGRRAKDRGLYDGSRRYYEPRRLSHMIGAVNHGCCCEIKAPNGYRQATRYRLARARSDMARTCLAGLPSRSRSAFHCP
jgi:hypothetical protein